MSRYEYKMVQIPPNVMIAAKSLFGRQKVDPKEAAALYLQSAVAEHATGGWEFMRVDQLGVVESPGCLASLFGQTEATSYYSVITFRRASDG